jgi:hydrogenase maturation protease
MENLGQQLRSSLQGRLCVMGVGNVDYSDDGFGVYVAEELLAAGVADVIIAGTAPERYLALVADQSFDDLLLIDALDFGKPPGTVILLNAAQIVCAFPQISTHKISLSVLAKVLEEAGTRVWLLGVQPETLRPGHGLSPMMHTSMEIVRILLRDLAQVEERQGTRDSEKAMA